MLNLQLVSIRHLSDVLRMGLQQFDEALRPLRASHLFHGL